jgi:hypothetical protein
MKNHRILFLVFCLMFLAFACSPPHEPQATMPQKTPQKIDLDIAEANRLAELPLGCIQTPLPYKSGVAPGASSCLLWLF